MRLERHAQTQARNSLSQALYEIRKVEKALDVALVERDGERLRLASEGVSSDLHALNAQLDSDPLGVADQVEELLADFELAEEGFAEWLAAARRATTNTSRAKSSTIRSPTPTTSWSSSRASPGPAGASRGWTPTYPWAKARPSSGASKTRTATAAPSCPSA